MGNQVFPFENCKRDVLRDPNPNPRPILCGRSCGRACTLDEKDGFGCDPAGVVFDDTTRQLPDLDGLAFRFAGSGNLAALRWLFVYGASAQACDSNCTTLLHVACRTGSIHIVKDLVRRGLSPDTSDRAGWTPLHVASCMGRQDVSLYLLHSGADPDLKNARGQTPEDLCSSSHTKEVVVGYDTHMRMRPLQRRLDVGGGAPSSLHFEPFFVPRASVLQEPQHMEELQQLGLDLFRASPGHGIAFLVASGVVPDYPVNINRFLVRFGANAEAYGDFLGGDFPISETLRLEFLNSLHLVGTGVVSALQVAFRDVAVPADWQKADRLARGISHFWWQQHGEELELSRTEGATGLPRASAAGSSSSRAPVHGAEELGGLRLHASLGGPEGLHRLMFSTIMLHQWFRAGHQLTLNEWAQLNTCIDDRGSDIQMSVQVGIYNTLRDRRLSLGKSDNERQPPLAPLFEGWAFVRYRGRAQVSHDGDPAAWFRQSPRVLAAQGGVTSAGMASLAPTLLGQAEDKAGEGPVARPASPVEPAEGGAGREEAEDRAWMTLHDSVLLFAHAPDALPYAFVALSRATFASSSISAARLCLIGRPPQASSFVASQEPPRCADNANWLELCLLLNDGRYQLLEAPQLEVRFAPTEFDSWLRHLSKRCNVMDTVRV